MAIFVTQVVPHINKEASGPSYSVLRLCQSLSLAGVGVLLGSLDNAERDQYENPFLVIRFRKPSLPPYLLGLSQGLKKVIFEGTTKSAVIHNHGLWMMPNVYAAHAAKKSGVLLVTSPRGTLSEWALRHSRWKKKLFWPIQKSALVHADCLHATALSEYDDIRRLGLKAPVAIIPNGIDVPDTVADFEQRSKRVLFLSRIHPKKNPELLLECWKSIEKSHSDWQLTIAGVGETSYVQELKQKSERQGLRSVQFLGPVYGEEKAALYQSASLFVLPTHSENFGMVVAEALSNGTPCIVTRGAPWEGLVENRCGWWVKNNKIELLKALEDAMSRAPEALQEMGEYGRTWMEADFAWPEIGRRMHETYRWLLAQRDRPDWVILD